MFGAVCKPFCPGWRQISRPESLMFLIAKTDRIRPSHICPCCIYRLISGVQAQAPVSSVRRQLPSPRGFPRQGDGSPSNVQNRAKLSPARHRFSPVDVEDAKPVSRWKTAVGPCRL